MTDIFHGLGSNPWTIVASNFYTALFAFSIIWIAYRLGKDDGSYVLNWLICLLGILIGWIAGIFASPYNTNESQEFLTIGQTISAFLSGFLISKIDRFIESSLYKDGALREKAWTRLALFIVSFLLTVIIVFINRSYFDNDNKNIQLEKLNKDLKIKQKAIDSLSAKTS